MAAKPKTDTVVLPPNFQLIEPEQESPEQEEINDVLAQLGGIENAEVYIYQVSNGRDKRGGAYVDTVHPSTFSLQWLKDTYGAGDYRIHVKSRGQLITNRLVQIAETKRPVQIAAPAVSSTPDYMAQMLQTMQTGFNRLGELIVQAATVNRAPAIDPDTVRRGMMQDMLTMKQLFGPAETQSQADKSIEMLMKGMELAKEIVPKTGDTSAMDILSDAIKTLGAPIAAAVMSGQGVGNAAQFGSVPAVTPNPSSIMSTAPGPSREISPQPPQDENMLFGHYVKMLTGFAKENRDPYLYADLIMDQAGKDAVNNLITRPDLIEFLAGYDPEVKNHLLWFEELKLALTEIMAEENPSTSTLTPTPIPVSVNANQSTVIFPHAPDGNNQHVDADNGDASTDS